MESQPLDDHPPSPLPAASRCRALQNHLSTSAPSPALILHRSFQSPFSEPRETFPQPLPISLAARHYPPPGLPLCRDSADSSQLVKVRFQQRNNGDLQEGDEVKQHCQEASQKEEEEEEEEEGGALQHRGRDSVSGKIIKQAQDKMYGKLQAVSAVRTHESLRDEEPSAIGRTLESPRASAAEDGHEAFVDEGDAEASVDEDGAEASVDESSQTGSRSFQGESEIEKENSNDSSSGKGMANEDEKGEVSPLRALSHIAHIKRRQDCMQDNAEQLHASYLDAMNEFSADTVLGSPSKKKKFKQVQFQLEPLTHQKLMRLLIEKHEGSFQRFVMATLDSIVMQDKSERKPTTIARKPSFSKWKRTRFDQLKGTETQELALAFKSLAECTPTMEVTPDLMHTPWQELTMLQIQKMLEETKKMLLINEKVHNCPYADCGRRFSTPGNLKDHLNEHSGEHPYSCSFEDCLHRFRSKQHLCRHMKKHERAHTCMFDGCNKRFAFRERLIVHQKIHSDERPLLCPWEGCGKTFKWANSLHGHMRTHTGEKPFQCTFAGCGRLFGYKVDLTRHRRTHFGQPARASHKNEGDV